VRGHVQRPVLALALLAALAFLPGCGSDSGGSAEGTTAATTTAASTSTATTTGESASASKESTRHAYVTRPDLKPPIFEVTKHLDGTAPGYLFIAAKDSTRPGGPMILDDDGRVEWFRDVSPLQATDFRVQTYHGKPVLTWWQGTFNKAGIGRGRYEIYDDTYHRIAEVDAGNGVHGDLHEFSITPRDTALLVAYNVVPRDLTSVGGVKNGWVYDSVVQEVDIATGRVLFDWRSLGHVPLVESMLRKPVEAAAKRKGAFDYFHVNSVDVDDDGNLIISARNTHAIYKISRSDGHVIWRLGGRKSDFEMGPGTTFGYQHDARRQPDGTLTLFDNSSTPAIAKYSRGLVLQLDEKNMRASLVHAYIHPKRILSPHQGDLQRLPDGHVIVGWGGEPYVSEFTGDGQALLDGHLLVGDTYRGYRFPWAGRPTDRPRAVVDGDDVYVSWNGATDVVSWEVRAGDDETSLKTVQKADKDGFETKIPLGSDAKLVEVRALDGAGRPLAGGASAPVSRS
jgi:hypothetical protein